MSATTMSSLWEGVVRVMNGHRKAGMPEIQSIKSWYVQGIHIG